jgi:hypothetical protein
MDASASDHAQANDVVATYADLESARAAITLLERHGVEGGAIELVVPGEDERALTNDAMRDVDMQATGNVGKRAGIGLLGGAVLGAVIGAVLGALASSVFDIYDTLPMAIGGALALGAMGAYAGGFYGGASGLPVSDAWGETFDAEHQRPTGQPRLAVHTGDRSKVDDVVEALRGTGALSLRRADDQGRLVDA